MLLGDVAHISNGCGDVQDADTIKREGWYPFFDRSEEQKWFPTYSIDKEAIIYAGEGQSFYPRYYKGKFALHQRCYAITDFSFFKSSMILFWVAIRSSSSVINLASLICSLLSAK